MGALLDFSLSQYRDGTFAMQTFDWEEEIKAEDRENEPRFS